MDNIFITDDDRHTSSNDESLSDDTSSVATETLLPVYKSDQQQIYSMINGIRVCPVKVKTDITLPNLKIKHPYQSDDNENNPFIDEKKVIIDKHVKVSHINRSSLHDLKTNISLLGLDEHSRRKSTSNVSVSVVNKRISKSINGNLNNGETTQMISRESTVRVSRIPTAANINQGSNQKIIASKPMVTRLSLSNEPPVKMKKKKKSHVSVKHAPINSKKSS